MIVVAAEALGTQKVLTLDRKDFETYHIREGHRHLPVCIVSWGRAAGLSACGSRRAVERVGV